MTRLPFRRLQSGDTIVEVLIAIAVVSAVLMGAFLVTSKSVTGVRNSQEHAEILQVLQGQVEQLRALALQAKDTSDPIFAGGNFCISDADPANPVRVNNASAAPACKNIQGRYNVSVSYNETSKVFTFTGTWDALGGGTNKEQLRYRLYPGQATINAFSDGNDDHTLGLNGDAFFNTESSNNGGGGSGGSSGNDNNNGNGNGSGNTGSYHYNTHFINRSENDPSKVLGCTWDWGDGTIENFPANAAPCQTNGMSSIHYYTPKGVQLPYPQGCNADKKDTYTVILTMKIAGLSPYPHWSRTIDMPLCF